jgi:hypothetical protein
VVFLATWLIRKGFQKVHKINKGKAAVSQFTATISREKNIKCIKFFPLTFWYFSNYWTQFTAPKTYLKGGRKHKQQAARN